MTNVRQVWFTPWFSVDRELSVGPVRILPGEAVLKAVTADELKSLSTIFGAYRDIAGRSIPTPCVFGHGPDPLDDVDDRHADMFEAATMLAFLSIAENDYLHSHGDLANSSHFSLVGQDFTPGGSGVALSSRRRNGSARDGGYDYAKLQIPCPVEARPRRQRIAESSFRNAINENWGTDLGRRIRRAAFWFTRANTDRSDVPLEAEVKMMGTVFEVLAALKSEQKGNPIRGFIANTLQFENETRPGWVAKPGWKKPAAAQTWTTFEFCWNDFYRLRNAIEHEGHDTKDVPAGAPSWSAWKHLLVATILVPSLVQRLLKAEGLYQCSEDDQRTIEVVEGLLLQPGFFEGGTATFEDLVSRAKEEWVHRQLAAAINKHHAGTDAE